MLTNDPGGPVSDAEVRQLFTLLARYASHELDQWENWSIDQAPYTNVYVRLSRGHFPDGHREDWYSPVWPIPPKLAQ